MRHASWTNGQWTHRKLQKSQICVCRCVVFFKKKIEGKNLAELVLVVVDLFDMGQEPATIWTRKDLFSVFSR